MISGDCLWTESIYFWCDFACVLSRVLIPSALGNLWPLFVYSESSWRERNVVTFYIGHVLSDSVHRDVFVLSVRSVIGVLCQITYCLSADGLESSAVLATGWQYARHSLNYKQKIYYIHLLCLLPWNSQIHKTQIVRKNLRTLHISTRPHSHFRQKSCGNV